MKRIFALMSAIALLASVSCGEKTEAPKEIKLNEPVYNEEGLPVIRVGTYGYTDPILTDPMQKPRDMAIEIVSYSKDVDKSLSWQEREEASKRNFDNALISGDVPDILLMPAYEVMRLDKQGVLTDLFALMDQYDGIKREDFTDCALEGLTVDGRFPAIMESYNIETAVAKTKYVPKEYQNWTAADAMSFCEKYSGTMPFGEYYAETDMADYMLRAEWMSCIDQKNVKCDFSGAFTDLLDFCKNNKPDLERDYDFGTMTEDDQYFYIQDQESRGRNDAQLVYPLRITGFNASLAQNTFGYLRGEDITFVGYPSEDGCGAIVTPTIDSTCFFCITEQCCNKELAWKLVNNMIKNRPKLEKNMITDQFGVSVFKSRLQEEYDLSDDYSNSIDTAFPDWTDDFSKIKITQEYKDMLWDYILSVPANPYIPERLRSMVEEEYQPVISDNRTAQQAADILNNRIETYLSEKS